MGQPATAGVIVGVIFIVLIGSFVGYRVYRRVQWRRLQKRQAALELAADGERAGTLRGDGIQSPGPVHFPMRSTSPGPSMVGSLYGDALPRHSFGGSMSKTSFRTSTPTPYHAVNGGGSEYGGSFQSRPRRANSAMGMLQGVAPLGEASAAPSMPGSPNSQGEGGAFQNDAFDGITHTRALSSASSTMTLRRMYAAGSSGSTYRGLGGSSGGSGAGPVGGAQYGSNLPQGAAPPRRSSYLPHLPGNRDAIQIVPPQPLGFSFGMAQALDQRTLAFSKTSGIGELDDEFSRDLLWSQTGIDPSTMTDAEASAALQAHLNRGGTVAEEDRLRYLAQGPSRTLSPVQRGAIHNHIYDGSQPGSSGVRTPDDPASRPRSPAPPHLWDGSGSSSDIGPSVSQRGGLSHPLEATGSNRSANNTPPRGNAVISSSALGINAEHSPLTLMSGDDGNDTQADMSFNTVADSPILKAFQTPAQANASRHATALAANQSDVSGGDAARRPMHAHNDSVHSTHAGVTTPALMSADDGQSRSSSQTGPPSLPTHQQPPRLPSPVADESPEQSKRTSRGWFSGWRTSTSGPSPA